MLVKKNNAVWWFGLGLAALAWPLVSCGGAGGAGGKDSGTKPPANAGGSEGEGALIACDNAKPCPVGMTCAGGYCEPTVPGEEGEGEGAVEGEGAPGTPTMQVVPTGLDFGSVAIGSSKNKGLTITNAGSGTLTIAQWSLGGGQGFAMLTPPEVPLDLGPGQDQLLTLSFSPAAGGQYADDLTIIHNGEGSPTKVSLVGVGGGAAATLSVTPPGPLEFGSVAVGNTSDKTITLKNEGAEETADITITALELRGPGAAAFAATPPGGVLPVLSPGEPAAITVSFKPTSPVASTATLAILNEGSDTPEVTVELSGAGLAGGVDLVPSSIDFGEIVFTQESQPRLVSVVNTGSDSFQITAITTDPSDSFVITQQPLPLPTLVAASAKKEIYVKFVPQSEGEFNGSLDIATTLPGVELLSIPLHGVGASLPVATPIAAAEIKDSHGATEGSFLIGVNDGILLDASDSSDPTPGAEAGIAQYNWEITDGPPGSDAAITPIGSNYKVAKFNTTQWGTYTVRLIVVNNGGRASTNPVELTIRAYVQDFITIETDWVDLASGGDAGTQDEGHEICYGDERDVDPIFVGPDSSECKEPADRNGAISTLQCDFGSFGAAVWRDGIGPNWRQPEIIEYMDEPFPDSWDFKLKVQYVDDRAECEFLCTQGCIPKGVTAKIAVKRNSQVEKSWEIPLPAKGQPLDVANLNFNHGRWTITDLVTP